MKKIRFIVNPNAGLKRKNLWSRISQWLEENMPEAELVLTDRAGHGAMLAREAVEKHFESVIAVGGDGSVNEIAGVLAGSSVNLGIIPCGSGNGVARHFCIPMSVKRSLEIVKAGKVKRIDTCKANGRTFVMLAGMGFDAHIAELFSHEKKRGVRTYARLSVSRYGSYPEQLFRIKADGKTFEERALMVIAANCTQFGNNATIAPGALPDDGLMNLIIIRKMAVLQLPYFALKLFTGNLKEGPHIKMLSARTITVQQEGGECQVDGELFSCGNQLDISIQPLSLNIIIP